MDYPKRKQIHLKEFDYGQNGAYFVTICTYGRAALFGKVYCDDVGAHPCVRPSAQGVMIRKWIEKIGEKYPKTTIDKYVIMPDHIHFIIRVSSDNSVSPLAEVIKWFKTQTTNEYIRNVNTGAFPPFEKHIWQRNYYEHVIRGEADYCEIWEYIENNPVKWVQTHGDLRNGRTHGCAPTTLK